MSISVQAQQELREVVSEMETLSSLPSLSAQQKTRFAALQTRASALKSGALVTDETRRADAAKLAKEFGFSEEKFNEQQRANRELRGYLRYGREVRTYTGMNVAVDADGGFTVPAGYFRDRVFSMLKATDRLFDPSVVTMYESENGNVLSVPMLDDTETSATIVTENFASVEGEITTVDRLQLAKVPTWRSKKIVWSYELLQDSAFPAEDIIADAIAVRFQRGIGAANVTTLLGAATSGATSAAAAIVGYADLLALVGSIDPSYLASPKCFWTMNFATLIGILGLKDSAGRPIIRPRTDANGNFLLLEKPVALCPSMPTVAANSKSVALGDMSKFFNRTVKNTLRLQSYTEAQGLAENGLLAFEGFVRSNSGLLVASGADSPVKFLTQATS